MSHIKNPGPLTVPRLWNLVAQTYAEEIAPQLAMYAEDALRLAQVEPGMLLADVACGPGDLSFEAARRGARPCAIDFSPQMIRSLRERTAREGGSPMEACVGDGMALPCADGAFDRAFSLFGLIFFPSRARGFGELRRILKPGGRAVVGSWVPFERVPILDDIYGTLGGLLPALPFNGQKAPLGDADGFRGEMLEAGFRDVEVHEVAHSREVDSVEQYWNMLARSTPPIHAVREKVGQEKWPEVVRDLLGILREKWGTGPQRVSLIANLAVGRR